MGCKFVEEMRGSVLFVVDEGIGETAEKRNLVMLEGVNVSVSMQAQECDQNNIPNKHQPGNKAWPGEEKMYYKDSTEQHAGLPRMKADIVTLVFYQE